jgi:hypothetical protein
MSLSLTALLRYLSWQRSTTLRPSTNVLFEKAPLPTDHACMPTGASALHGRLWCRELEIAVEEFKRGVLAQRLRGLHLSVQRLVVHDVLHVVRTEGIAAVVVEQEAVGHAALLLLHTRRKVNMHKNALP